MAIWKNYNEGNEWFWLERRDENDINKEKRKGNEEWEQKKIRKEIIYKIPLYEFHHSR